MDEGGREEERDGWNEILMRRCGWNVMWNKSG